jgi:hypothetical protein
MKLIGVTNGTLPCFWVNAQEHVIRAANVLVMVQSGRAMAQVVSRRPFAAEARVRARVNPCGICGGQSGTGTGFSTSSSVFPLSISFHRRSPNSYHLGNA